MKLLTEKARLLDAREQRPHGALGYLTPSEYAQAGWQRSLAAVDLLFRTTNHRVQRHRQARTEDRPARADNIKCSLPVNRGGTSFFKETSLGQGRNCDLLERRMSNHLSNQLLNGGRKGCSN